MTEFAAGGTIPARPEEDDDEVPALLAEGCACMTPREAIELDRFGVTPEMLARLNAEVRP